MFVQSVILLTVGIALASAFPFDGRIVNGTAANIEDYNFMLSLQFNGGHTCGASILNENTAITATHCTRNRNHAAFSVRAGSASRTSGGVVVAVSQVIEHPGYNPSTLDNDITILKLASPLVFSSTIGPIGLPDRMADLPHGHPATIAGWGTIEYRGSSPDLLLRADVPIVGREECAIMYGTTSGIGERQMCAGKEFVDACQGDSGGPLIYNNINWGLVSWGFECARANAPSVFARTAYFIDWIEQYL